MRRRSSGLANRSDVALAASAPSCLSGNFQRDKWCCERGLNSRPLPYQGSALPLSYRSPRVRRSLAYQIRKRKRGPSAADVRSGSLILRDLALPQPQMAGHLPGCRTWRWTWALRGRDGRLPHGDKSSETTAQAVRRARLAEELRANLQRRKAQARSRRRGDADKRPDGLQSAAPPDEKSEA